MRRYLSIVLSIILLIGIIIISARWTQAFYRSAENYNSPLSTATLSPQETALQKRANVVVVLVGGLGYEALQTLSMPVFERLTQSGATAVIQSSPPSYSQTTQASLITGAPPETNSASLFDKSVNNLSLISIDTIFARAHEHQQKTAIFGPAEWRRLIPRNHLDETFFVNASGPEADQAILETALPTLNSNTFDLVLIHLSQMDFAARYQGGPSGNAYRQAASRTDNYLNQISQATNMSNSVLLVLGDHGYTSSGGYGGAELEIIQQPITIVGESITPGNYNDIRQTDIAPTISTLLGMPPPAAAQGRILFEMLRLNKENKTLAQLALAQQRILLAKAYLAEIEGSSATLPDSLFADLAQAQNAFTQNNTNGAFQLALLTQDTADTQMAITRYTQIRSEQWPRLVLTLLVLTIWITIMWRRRGSHAGLIIVATIVTIGLYHILYQLQGYSYSISAFNNFSQVPFDIARRTAVSMLAGGGLLLILLMLISEENWAILLGTGYGFGVLVTFVFALPLFWVFWQNGLTITWYLPAVDTVFWHITSLLAVIIAAILGLLLPWPIMFLNILVNQVRVYLDRAPSSTEPDTLPGLHL